MRLGRTEDQKVDGGHCHVTAWKWHFHVWRWPGGGTTVHGGGCARWHATHGGTTMRRGECDSGAWEPSDPCIIFNYVTILTVCPVHSLCVSRLFLGCAQLFWGYLGGSMTAAERRLAVEAAGKAGFCSDRCV